MFVQGIGESGQGMTDDVAVAVIVDELDPGMRVVGLAGDVAEGEPKAMSGGRVEFDFARNVLKASGVEQFVVLVQAIEGVEEEVEVTTTAGGLLDQDAAGIVQVDPHAAEGTFDQGAAVGEGRTRHLATELRDDLAQLGGVDVLRHPFPFRVLLGQDLFGGAICVHVQAEMPAGWVTPGTVPNWGSAGEPVCQEMLNDLFVMQATTKGGPGRWALTSTGDDPSRVSVSKQSTKFLHPG